MNISTRVSNSAAPAGAFTFVELLVIVAMLGLGALMLAPALARTKTISPTFQCMNNLGQLQHACAMYAADNAGRLAPNLGKFTYNYSAWCNGVLDWGLGYGSGSLGESLPPNVNTNYLVKSLLGPYVARNPSYYRCPADKFPSAVGSRVRSYSMNAFVGAADNTLSTTYSYGLTYRLFQKDSDLTKPGPSMTWVLTEEHPDSINDCYLVVDMPAASTWPTYTPWQDLPASPHNNAGCLSFADGHVEAHQWVDAQTLAPVLKLTQWQAGVPGLTLKEPRAWGGWTLSLIC